MNGKQNRKNSQQRDRYRIHESNTEHPVQSDTSKKAEGLGVSGSRPDTRKPNDTAQHNQESKEIDHQSGQTESPGAPTDKTLPDEQRIDKDGTGEHASGEDKNDKTIPDLEEERNNRVAERRRPDEAQPRNKQTGTVAGRHDKTRNFGSFYLGVAAAFLVAALGLSLSTLPIFLSIPLSAVLFGIGIWMLSYASLQSPDQSPESGPGMDRHTTTVVVTAVLLVLQTFIMDVFIFTRLGSVQKHQNPVIIIWIAATVIETIAAFTLIFRHNPSSSMASPSQGTKEQDSE